MQNQLWFGDNLAILREEIADESVDLVYLDPPFNSQANYNILFKMPAEDAATAQVEAFRDTWSWGAEAKWAFDEIMHTGGGVASIVHALHAALGDSDMMAYLVMMSQRLHELRRVLKPTGSLYLHCDPTASHYLKVVLDSIFGVGGFRNEITWQRTASHGDSKSWSRVADQILFYTKATKFTWNPPYLPHSDRYIESHYSSADDAGRQYQLTSILSPSPRPNMMYEWKGFPSPPLGWRFQRERMAELDEAGLIWYPTHPDGSLDTTKRPRFKRYLDEQKGTLASTIWTDIPPVNARARERIGYPTQKPVALLDRIIRASTSAGDIILDPFCGCGTTVAAAQAADRMWIGIDVAYHAIRVIEDRLADMPGQIKYDLGGIPRDFAAAARLAERDKYQFQWWANYLVGVQALKEIRKGPDRGIDGQLHERASRVGAHSHVRQRWPACRRKGRKGVQGGDRKRTRRDGSVHLPARTNPRDAIGSRLLRLC
ncbi:site-specific DNA-methyltransferase [Mesorhizobium sp. BR-1-1-10]|nr:site-specific DNA-methyltransferase [Mesorhizobium sp. BR-1-1-10]MBZ9974207.1 site-specific DNA-methyltransferase [Mesorhizobium sp. BR-1-1-10]